MLRKSPALGLLRFFFPVVRSNFRDLDIQYLNLLSGKFYLQLSIKKT